MIIRESYVISGDLYQEALEYAELSKDFTSNRHDFHPGGLLNKKIKMFEGKLGEKAVKMLFMDNDICFKEDHSSYNERDEYDFLLINETEQLKVDVKTRTESFHIRTLEMVEQAKNHPKDIFISARLYKDSNMINKNQIENQGYLDNYVMYDRDLRSLASIESELLYKFKKI